MTSVSLRATAFMAAVLTGALGGAEHSTRRRSDRAWLGSHSPKTAALESGANLMQAKALPRAAGAAGVIRLERKP